MTAGTTHVSSSAGSHGAAGTAHMAVTHMSAHGRMHISSPSAVKNPVQYGNPCHRSYNGCGGFCRAGKTGIALVVLVILSVLGILGVLGIGIRSA